MLRGPFLSSSPAGDAQFFFTALPPRALLAQGRRRGVELPEEWWTCIVEDYTPRQKRFAEICREVIVPELKRLIEGGAENDKNRTE